MTIKIYLRWGFVFNIELYYISSLLSTLFLCLMYIWIATSWGTHILRRLWEKTLPFCQVANANLCESLNRRLDKRNI